MFFRKKIFEALTFLLIEKVKMASKCLISGRYDRYDAILNFSMGSNVCVKMMVISSAYTHKYA